MKQFNENLRNLSPDYVSFIKRITTAPKTKSCLDVPVLDVGLEVPLRQVRPAASVAAVSGSSVVAHVNRAQTSLLNPHHFVFASGTLPCGPGVAALFVEGSSGALVTKHMFTGDHPPVDQDGFVTLVTIVDHWIHHLQISFL